MSTREMICELVNNSVDTNDLELLYNLILKFIPSDIPLPDELEAIKETENETEFIPYNNVNWEWNTMIHEVYNEKWNTI